MVEKRLGVIPATVLLWAIASALFLGAVYYVFHYGQLITEKVAAPITFVYQRLNVRPVAKRVPRVPLSTGLKEWLRPLQLRDFLFAAWNGLAIGGFGWYMLSVEETVPFVVFVSAFAVYTTLVFTRWGRAHASQAAALEPPLKFRAEYFRFTDSDGTRLLRVGFLYDIPLPLRVESARLEIGARSPIDAIQGPPQHNIEGRNGPMYVGFELPDWAGIASWNVRLSLYAKGSWWREEEGHEVDFNQP